MPAHALAPLTPARPGPGLHSCSCVVPLTRQRCARTARAAAARLRQLLLRPPVPLSSTANATRSRAPASARLLHARACSCAASLPRTCTVASGSPACTAPEPAPLAPRLTSPRLRAALELERPRHALPLRACATPELPLRAAHAARSRACDAPEPPASAAGLRAKPPRAEPQPPARLLLLCAARSLGARRARAAPLGVAAPAPPDPAAPLAQRAAPPVLPAEEGTERERGRK
ncbi:vegetative cell wall protein gp1-like [Panicum hallii]|uniref:vegetative cell wall protein gp1-like n=1 Tax=Panicum hallii TaxID=206008 RepID=UPI000DF4D3C0|nr:vegetative cell wall protein gp1-like [Panicum hallii]